MNRKRLQNGNVLFIVLAGIALFAALVMAFMRSDNTNSGAVLSQAEAKVAAGAIMRFGSDVEQAVRRLTSIHGCDITQVSFEKSPFDGSDTDYVNPNSPADEHCHVFSPNGGQVQYITFEDDWKDTTFTAGNYYGDFIFSITCVENVGITGNCNIPAETKISGEIVLYAPYIKEAICSELAKKLMSADVIPTDSYDAFQAGSLYKGDFSYDVANVDFNTVAGEAALYNTGNFKSGCFKGDNIGVNPLEGSFNYYNTVYQQ